MAFTIPVKNLEAGDKVQFRNDEGRIVKYTVERIKWPDFAKRDRTHLILELLKLDGKKHSVRVETIGNVEVWV